MDGLHPQVCHRTAESWEAGPADHPAPPFAPVSSSGATGALSPAWKATHYVCAKRLLPSLPDLVAVLERLGHLQLTEEERRQVLAMSLSTAERYLRTQRKPRLHGLSMTTPGPWSKARYIWCRPFPRGGETPRLCGNGSGGPLWGPSRWEVSLHPDVDGSGHRLDRMHALAGETCRCRAGRPGTGPRAVPFPLLGIDTDSGSEFLNAEVIADPASPSSRRPEPGEGDHQQQPAASAASTRPSSSCAGGCSTPRGLPCCASWSIAFSLPSSSRRSCLTATGYAGSMMWPRHRCSGREPRGC